MFTNIILKIYNNHNSTDIPTKLHREDQFNMEVRPPKKYTFFYCYILEWRSDHRNDC
jgi:hypothetical protein